MAQPSLTATEEPVAVIDGQRIYESEVLSLVQAQLRQLRSQEYEIKSKGLETLIQQRVLEIEAKKKGVSADSLLAQEVDSKVLDPTDAEIEAFYESQKSTLDSPLEKVKGTLRQQLKYNKVQKARQEYFLMLREQNSVAVLLSPPKTEVTYDSRRIRGKAGAPVTIVEFSDYQCPYCKSVQPTLTAVLKKYDGKVKLAFRDLPLRTNHPNAQTAAEAARCAGEQDKFWEYHDLLFANQSRLDASGLLERARALQLDEKEFESCVSSGKYKAEIEQDLQDALRAGVQGTPGFFINGIYLNGAQPAEAFDKAITREIEAIQSKERFGQR